MSVWLPASVFGAESVGFESDQAVRRQHVVVAGLHSEEIAAGALEGVEVLNRSNEPASAGDCRAGVGRRPVGAAGRIAEMAADIKSGPAVNRERTRRLERQGLQRQILAAVGGIGAICMSMASPTPAKCAPGSAAALIG